MDRPRLIRGLRIAVSAVFGILCVVVIMLWVRSYYACDIFTWNDDSGETERGILYLVRTEAPPGFVDDTVASGWTVTELSEVDDDGNLANMMTRGDGTRKTIETMEGPGLKVVAIKMYAPLLLFTALAATPFVRLSRFSLRTLLIATTLIAVVLGLVVALNR